MTTPIFTIQPDIEITVKTIDGEKCWNISFFAPSTEDFTVQSKQSSLRTLKDDSLSLTVVPVSSEDVPDGDRVFDVRVIAPGRFADIARITVTANEVPLKTVLREFNNALQSSFVKALRAAIFVPEMVGPMQYPANDTVGVVERHAVASVVTTSPTRKWWRPTWKRAAVSFLSVFAVTLIILGLIPAKRIDPVAEAAQEGSYASIQAKIKKQIADAANHDQPAIGALQGQTIAIETMKAMGLDPGKANAGCLVGVKK